MFTVIIIHALCILLFAEYHDEELILAFIVTGKTILQLLLSSSFPFKKLSFFMFEASFEFALERFLEDLLSPGFRLLTMYLYSGANQEKLIMASCFFLAGCS